MKKTLIFAAAALTVFAACSKEQDIVTPEVLPDGKVRATFVAEVEQTKATESLENNIIKFAWQASDVIAAVDKNASVINEFSCSNASTGEFTGTHSGEFAYAIAPFAAAKSMVHISDQTGELVEYTITLPDTYTDYVPGTTNAIMVGTPNGNNKFLFRHVAAILKITVANVPVGTKSFWLKTNKKISGDYTFDSLTGVEIAETATTETEVALELKDAVTVPNQTLSFYVPVPTGSYTDFTVTLRDENLGELVHKGKSGLSMTLNRGDVYYTPTITLDAVDIPKGAEWAYTFEQKVFNENGTVTLSGTTDMDWTLAGDDDDKYWGYDATKGQQFGSGSKAYSSLSLSSSFGANYGISDVKINTSGANSIVGTVSVIVGNVAYKCENAESVDLTKDATDYTFSSPDGNNHSGDVVISYEQTSSKAIYLKSIVINPAAQLPQVATPTFSPAGGSYTETQNVTISCETADATIYYTLDGTDPSNQSTAYTSAIEISATTTVKAFAVKDGMADSEVAEAKYTISNTPAPTTGWIETALGDISSSDVFVIVGNNGDNYAMNHTTLNNSGAPTATAVSVTGSALSADPSDELKWNLSSDASGYMFYPDGVTDKWLNLIANNNGLRVSNTAANGKYWSLDAASGYLIGTDTADATRYIGIYNSTDWRSYTSINSNIASQTIKFYKYVSAPDNRQEAGMSWSAASATASWDTGNVVSGFTAPTLTKGNASVVTYESTNTAVATTSVAGEVSIVGPGETTIKAIFAGDNDYKPQTVSYTLTVTDNRAQVATPTFDPAAGSVPANTNVQILCATQGATIYYTVDGSNPSTASLTGDAVEITAATTIKAFAVLSGYKDSEVATAAYTIQSNLNTSTEQNPYSPSEAIKLANDNSASLPIDDVYIKGIVSQTGTVNNSGQVNYYISNDGTTTNQVEMYKGKYISGAEFTEATNMRLGDLVLVKGSLLIYNNTTVELAENNVVISVLRAPTFSPAGGVYQNAQSVTLTADNGATIYYTIDGSTPTTSSTLYSSAIAVSANTTIKAIAVKDSEITGVASATYTIDTNANDGSEQKPFTVAEAVAAYTANSSIGDKYVKGIISQAGWTSNNKTNCYISDDGTTTAQQFELYNITSGQSAADLTVGSAVLAHGTITKYNSTYETSPSIIAVLVAMPSISGDVNFVSSTPITLSATAGATIYYTTDGTDPTTASTEYTAAFDISATTTVKAIAAKDGLVTAVASKTFNKVQAYAVTWSAPSNGSITVKHGTTVLASGNEVPAGETINIEVEADNGYALASLVYNDGSDHDIKSAKSFTMPSHAVSITATFEQSGNTIPDPETITFADLNLTNSQQYSDPFNGGNFTITFGGGSNDGKYYTTGSGIRTYGGGTITIASSYNIVDIAFTWHSTYAPADDVAVPSGYSTTTKKWTGSAKSITLTRPSGSGHWRLQSVTVTYGK